MERHRNRTNVIIYGCGVMGLRSAEALSKKNSFSIVGAIDIDPELVGKDLGSLLDSDQNMGIPIQDDPDELFNKVDADAAVLTTLSHLEEVFPQIDQCIEAGLNVVSTCEELSYPWDREPDLARKIDDLAKDKGVTVVGTGINPGYLMDTLPLILTAPCLDVQSIKVTRMMDSSKRRIPFQKKIGTGLSLGAFRDKIDNKIITGHVGLLESINMIADGLGWALDEAVELPPEPVVADREVETGLGLVKPGDALGLVSIAYATMRGNKVITLEFNANAGVDEEYDEVIIEGIPNVHERIIGGIHGDVGTVAVTVNTIPRTVQSEPGLILMKDLPPVIATS
ncbi:MAG: dihydrodipicolinate reductase [Candidatus Aminicenantes bacterium]|nr:MAG: dihydrodipicolinate reductase [Candidatus Aminicenantes bacterium]